MKRLASGAAVTFFGVALAACASTPAPDAPTPAVTAVQVPPVAAAAQPVVVQEHSKIPLSRFRTCLAIEDGTKERLDCYDGIVPPEPKAVHARAKIISECRFIVEEDARLKCFNSFLVERPRIAASPPPLPAVRHTTTTKHHMRKGRGGCGSRGGAGYRLPSGKCASKRR
jgi:hypothetical protein